VVAVVQVKQVTLTDKCLEGTDYPVIFLVQLFFMQVEEEVVVHRIKEQVEQEVVVQEQFREQVCLEQQTLEVAVVQEIQVEVQVPEEEVQAVCERVLFRGQ
jgi:Fe-S cluster assembly scaffold protein SufB